ncbi:hypothetical protein PUN28_002248 [Cardiocondyla obscurior]|uniref:Uncharacterized protein n=1 Tax=Cardiocondyla obscurior TaxID=286306 RepID=A0AAW2GT90_9HYME
MSPRRTRAAEQSAVSTRSKVQKKNNVTEDVVKSVQKVRQSQRKKKLLKYNSDTSAEQSYKRKTSDEEVTISKSKKKKIFVNSSGSIRLSQDECTNNSTMKRLNNLSPLRISKDLNSRKMSNAISQQKVYIKLSPIVVTPKSTPPKLSLTPHRSKKTPKKSPIALGSPKTHALTASKLFKSPRKLSLATGNDSSEENSEAESIFSVRKSRKTKRNNVSDNSAFDRSTSISPKKTKKHKKSNKKLKVPKFSKSPKIVLKQSKSKKSILHKLKLFSLPKMEKSASKSPSPKKDKNLLSIERFLSNPKLIKALTSSQIKIIQKQPIVLLEKLSSENLKQKNKRNKSPSNTLINVKSPSIKTKRNSKTIEKASISTSIKRKSTSISRNSSAKKLRTSDNKRISPRIEHNAQIEKQNVSPLLFASSTPKVKKVASNSPIASVINTSFNTKSKRHSNMRLSNSLNKNSDIENISKPYLFDTEINETSQDLFSQNSTYEKGNTSKKEHDKNNTYELDQPQILNIQQSAKKRTSIDANLSLKNNTIKKAKVHFADATFNGGSVQKSINKFNMSRSNIPHNIIIQNKSSITNSTSKVKLGSSKLSKNLVNTSFKISSPKIDTKKLKIQLKGTQVTPKNFNTTEKKSEKKSSTKKIPNFDKIHKQMFAKSESIVDMKNRLKSRHLAFTANTAGSTANAKVEGKKPLETKDGVYNRFGFKLRKPEATNIIVKKQVVYSREKKQRSTWMMLQGVRTNRRFELQMKARNLNP